MTSAGQPQLLIQTSEPATRRSLERLCRLRGWGMDAASAVPSLLVTDQDIAELPLACQGIVFLEKDDTQPALPETRVLRLRLPIRLANLAASIEDAWERANREAERMLDAEVSYAPKLHRLTGPEGEADLAGKEADLLEALLDAGPEGIDRDLLLQKVWGYQPGLETHTLETHVYRLRQKLDQVSRQPVPLIAEDGRYRLGVG